MQLHTMAHFWQVLHLIELDTTISFHIIHYITIHLKNELNNHTQSSLSHTYTCTHLSNHTIECPHKESSHWKETHLKGLGGWGSDHFVPRTTCWYFFIYCLHTNGVTHRNEHRVSNQSYNHTNPHFRYIKTCLSITAHSVEMWRKRGYYCERWGDRW